MQNETPTPHPLAGELSQLVETHEAGTAAISANLKITAIRRDVELKRLQDETLAELRELERQAAALLRENERQHHDVTRYIPPTDTQLARFQEIRASLRAMSAAARKSVLAESIKISDRRIFEAVADAAGFVSGLADEEHSAFLRNCHSVFFAGEIEQLTSEAQQLSELLGRIEQFRESIDMVDQPEGYSVANV